MVTVEDLLKLYQFEELPVEGGIFKQSYLAAERIPQAALPARYPSDKPLARQFSIY